MEAVSEPAPERRGRHAGRPRRPTAAEYKAAVGTFTTGVAILAARVDGVDHAMTANAFTSVSLEPLLVAVCVARAARFHEAIVRADGWAISVLGSQDEPAARALAISGRPLHNQLAGFRYSRGLYTSAAVFTDALATVECRTYAVHDGGDHSIVLGEVLSVTTAEAPGNLGDPLLYFRGGYRRLAEE